MCLLRGDTAENVVDSVRSLLSRHNSHFFLSMAVLLPDSVGHGLAMEPGGGEAVRHHGTDTGRGKGRTEFHSELHKWATGLY